MNIENTNCTYMISAEELEAALQLYFSSIYSINLKHDDGKSIITITPVNNHVEIPLGNHDCDYRDVFAGLRINVNRGG